VKREAYQEQIAQVPLDKLVFLDECGFSLALYRLYGWVIGGGRCLETVPFHLQPGKAHSVMGALSLPTPDCPSGLPQRIAPADCPSGLPQRIAPADCPSGLRALWQEARAWNRASFEAFLQRGVLARRFAACFASGQCLGAGQRPLPSWRQHRFSGGGCWVFLALSAAILARLQSHRTALELAQSPGARFSPAL